MVSRLTFRGLIFKIAQETDLCSNGIVPKPQQCRSRRLEDVENIMRGLDVMYNVLYKYYRGVIEAFCLERKGMLCVREALRQCVAHSDTVRKMGPLITNLDTRWKFLEPLTCIGDRMHSAQRYVGGRPLCTAMALNDRKRRYVKFGAWCGFFSIWFFKGDDGRIRMELRGDRRSDLKWGYRSKTARACVCVCGQGDEGSAKRWVACGCKQARKTTDIMPCEVIVIEVRKCPR